MLWELDNAVGTLDHSQADEKFLIFISGNLVEELEYVWLTPIMYVLITPFELRSAWEDPSLGGNLRSVRFQI